MGRTDVNASLSWASSFARSCAAKFPGYIDRDDLASAGVLAYIQAADRYKSRLGASFRGYCATRIRGAVLDEMRRWTWAPRSVLQNRRRIRDAKRTLGVKLQREPTRQEVADEMGVELLELETIEMQSQHRQIISLNDTASCDHSEEHIALAERIPDANAAAPCADILHADDRRQMINSIRTLPKTQATIIVLHYLKNVPLREIAAVIHVTPSRVSQLHHQALEHMRQVCLGEGEAKPPASSPRLARSLPEFPPILR